MRRHETPPGGVSVTRVELSIGSLDLFRFVDYDHAFPRHSHERFTVGVFGARNGSIRFKRATWRGTEGSILAVPPDEAHAADPLRGSGWTYRTLYPSTRIVDLALESSRGTLSPVFDRPVIHDPQLARELFDLHTCLETVPPTLAMEEKLLESLRRLVLHHGSKRVAFDARGPTDVVAVARSYLDDNFGKPVKLAELSSVCGMSPFHLIRNFRDIVGMPPHAYLTQVRANRAREMLTRGEALSSAAYLCGFADQSHLTRTFKRIFGVTPGAYASGTVSGRRARRPSRSNQRA